MFSPRPRRLSANSALKRAPGTLNLNPLWRGAARTISFITATILFLLLALYVQPRIGYNPPFFITPRPADCRIHETRFLALQVARHCAPEVVLLRVRRHSEVRGLID